MLYSLPTPLQLVKRILSLLTLLAASYASFATVIVVQNTQDSGTGSLRAAVNVAQPGDIIRFSPSLLGSGNAVIQLDSELVVDQSIRVVGSIIGSDSIVLDGQNSTRIMRITGVNKVEIDSLVFFDGRDDDGGAITSNCDTLLVSNSQFVSNQGNDDGGAIYTIAEFARLLNVVFVDNYAASDGGALFTLADYFLVDDCTFSYNEAIETGGAVCFFGNGIYISIANSVFEGNHSGEHGGGVYLRPNSFFGSGNLELLINDSTQFLNNTAGGKGGGLFFSTGGFGDSLLLHIIDGSFFTENSAGESGGGAFVEIINWPSDVVKIENVSFDRNSSDEIIGGMFLRADEAFVTNVLFDSNSSVWSTGALFLHTNLSDTVVITDVSFVDNNAGTSDGAFSGYGSVVLNDCDFINNNAQSSCGAVGWDGSLHVLESEFFENSANHYGGAVCVQDYDALFERSHFLQNHAGLSGGGIFDANSGGCGCGIVVKECVFDSNSAGESGGAIRMSMDAVSLIDSCYFNANEAGVSGGAVSSDSDQGLLIRRSRFEKNISNGNGGALGLSRGTVVIDSGCVFKGNEAAVIGGAILDRADSIIINQSTFDSNRANVGGVIGTLEHALVLDIHRSTFSNNHADGLGGAFYSIWSESFIRLNVSTISGNYASDTGGVAYLKVREPGTLAADIIVEVTNSTLVSNGAGGHANGFFLNGGRAWDACHVRMKSSVIANNGPSDIVSSHSPMLISEGNNLLRNVYPGLLASDMTGINSTTLQLGPLQMNGGFNKTHMPLAGSPLINNGNPQDPMDAQNGPIQFVRDIGSCESSGCDQSIYSIVDECDSYLWNVNGQVYQGDTTITLNYVNQFGCDSNHILDLTLGNSWIQFDTAFACDYFITASGDSLTTSGIYVDSLQSITNCDSVVHLNLSINSIDTTLSIFGDQLSSNASGISYQWVDCNNQFAPIAGATSQTFQPLVNGVYAVILIDGNCVDTSDCYSVQNVGIKAFIESTIQIFPNPSNGELHVFSDTNIMRYEIYDLLGRSVMRGNLNEQKAQITLDLSGLNVGAYVLSVYAGKEHLVKQISIVE
ncbi:MAG: T9SS type A sorting domain-containing protein [Cyclobacteriaceae bacterium]